MINDHHSKECGTNINSDDCHGMSCLAGILREKRYISTYSKSVKNIFETYTLDRLMLACANAAWLRNLSSEEFPYNRNPYTDVDKLVLRLLAKEEVYEWHALNESFACMSTLLCGRVEGDSLFLENKGILSCIINTGYFAFCVDCGQELYTVECTTSNIQPGTISDGIPIPAGCTILSIREGAKTILISL